MTRIHLALASLSIVIVFGCSHARPSRNLASVSNEKVLCFAGAGLEIEPATPATQRVPVGYSPKTAYAMGVLSLMAYMPPEAVFPTARKLGFENVHFIHRNHSQVEKLDSMGYKLLRGDTEAIWLEKPGYAAVVFRGSDFKGTGGLEDLKTDLAVAPADMGSLGKVHGGFYSAYAIVRDDLQKRLKALQTDEGGAPKPVIVGGHSMGGSLAALFAADIMRETQKGIGSDARSEQARYAYRLQGLYTYGAPRVGNEHFATLLEHLIRQAIQFPPSGLRASPGFAAARFQNTWDLVSTLPPKDLRTLLFLVMDGNYAHDMAALEYIDSSSRILAGAAAAQKAPSDILELKSAPGDWLKSHEIEAYLVRLGSEIGRDVSHCHR